MGLYNACKVKIYSDPSRFGRDFARIELGNIFWKSLLEIDFQPGNQYFEVALNGSGKNKAKKKVIDELRRRNMKVFVYGFE